MFEPPYKLGNLPASFARLSTSPSDDSVADVAEKERRYAELVSGADYQNARLLADTWCAVFVWKKDTSDLGKLCPTERDFRKIENNPHSILPHVKSEVRRLADQYQFFHWHLAFPDVFRLPEEAEKAENEQTGWNRGFDVVLGQSAVGDESSFKKREWFASEPSEHRECQDSRAAEKADRRIAEDEPDTIRAVYECKATSRGNDRILCEIAEDFRCGGRGDMNTYPLFTETNPSSSSRPWTSWDHRANRNRDRRLRRSILRPLHGCSDVGLCLRL